MNILQNEREIDGKTKEIQDAYASQWGIVPYN